MKGFRKQAAFGSKKDRDEDLQLFREMFKRERERNNVNFLEMSEELDPSLGNQSLYNLPSGKKESGNDFLVTGRDKNDYDWLKTPPATPLFPSLDMEANDPNLMIFHRELPIMQNLKPSRFQGKMQEPKLMQRARSPSSRSSTSSSSRPETPSTRPTTSSGNAINLGGLMKQSASYANKKPSRSSTPSTRSTTPKKPSQPLGVSQITSVTRNRAVSVTRNRGLVEEPKVETSINPRRQSCSPSVIRGRKVESVEQISLKKATVDTTPGNGTVIMGSRMVEKMMNARRSAYVEEKDLQRKPLNLVGDRKDVGKLMSRSSLNMALKQMEISKNPSSTKNSTNGGSKPSSQMTTCSAINNFRDRTSSEIKPVAKKGESKIRSNNYA